MKRILLLGLVAALVAVFMLPGAAFGKDNGKSACKQGGWMDLVDADGQPFANQGACVKFAAQGGTPVPPGAGPGLLAIAYTNVDGVPGFDEAAGDVLIARLVDSDDDGVPSVGDTVETNEYPKDFDYGTAGFGSFGVTSHPVTDLFPGAGEFAVLSGGLDKFFIWHETSELEVYSEYDRNNAVTTYTEFTDVFTESLRFVDSINVNPVSPSQPADSLSMSREQIADDAFLEVDILPET